MSEILTPLSIDPHGRIATSSDPAVTTQQHLVSYLLTNPGERVMRPTFGTQLSNYVFENLDPVEYELLSARVVEKVSADVPDVRLHAVTPKALFDQGVLQVTVEFAPAVGIGQGASQSTVLNLGGTA